QMNSSAHNRHSRTSPVARVALLCACLSLFLGTSLAQPAAPVKSVLVLYWYGKDFTGNFQFEQFLRETLKATPNTRIDYFAEYLEEDRFPGDEQAELLHDYLARKYANRKIDVVVAITDPPLKFLLAHRADLFPESPIVFLALKSPPSEVLTAGPGLTGIVP